MYTILFNFYFTVLPTSFITNNCARMEEIKFLENFKSKCSHYRFSEALKPETYFKNLTIISITLRFKNISTEQPDLFQVSLRYCC